MYVKTEQKVGVVRGNIVAIRYVMTAFVFFFF